MVTIYTVCLGNICRSPIAEAVLRQSFEEAGLGDKVEVRSAGTAGYHQGEDADRRTNRVLAEHGYDLNHTAQKFTSPMFADADLVLVMDHSNYADVMSLASRSVSATDIANEDKVKMLLSFSPKATDLAEQTADNQDSWNNNAQRNLEVPDPWYGNMRDFEYVLGLIENSAPGVVEYVREKLLASN